MNNVVLIGRLTKDPDVRHFADTNNIMCQFILAVDRGLSKEKRAELEAQGKQTADFIRVKAFGKTAELCSKFLVKGIQVAIQGRIQTGSYTNQQGQRVYTTDVIIDRVEFIEWADNVEADRHVDNGNQFNNKQSDDDFIPFDDDSVIPF